MIEVFKLERELINIMDGFASKLQSKLDKINAYLEVSRYYFNLISYCFRFAH